MNIDEAIEKEIIRLSNKEYHSSEVNLFNMMLITSLRHIVTDLQKDKYIDHNRFKWEH